MSHRSRFGKFLRILGVVFLALTAVFHILGGIGTTCVALGAEKFESMAGIADFKWLYQLFVVLTVLIGAAGVWSVFRFARSMKGAYPQVLAVLVAGVVVTAAHVYASRVLRGASMPNDARLVMNLVTLVLFLLFRLPGLRRAMAFDHDEVDEVPGSSVLAAVILGLMTVSVGVWASGSHSWGSVNYAAVWNGPLQAVGMILTMAGFWLLVRPDSRLRCLIHPGQRS